MGYLPLTALLEKADSGLCHCHLHV